MSHGIVVAPKLAPTTNQPVTLPVTVIRRPANDIVAGKMEAIEKPRAMVAPEITGSERDAVNIVAKLTNAPTKLTMRMASGFTRAATGIINARPTVSDPQNRDVKYAAVIVVPNFVVTE